MSSWRHRRPKQRGESFHHARHHGFDCVLRDCRATPLPSVPRPPRRLIKRERKIELGSATMKDLCCALSQKGEARQSCKVTTRRYDLQAQNMCHVGQRKGSYGFFAHVPSVGCPEGSDYPPTHHRCQNWGELSRWTCTRFCRK